MIAVRTLVAIVGSFWIASTGFFISSVLIPYVRLRAEEARWMALHPGMARRLS